MSRYSVRTSNLWRLLLLVSGAILVTIITLASASAALAQVGTSAKMYWMEGSGLRRSNLDGSNVETVGPMTISPIDLDLAGGKVYWTRFNPTAGALRRANTDGTGIEDLDSPVAFPYGVARDLTNDKIYWSNGTLRRVDLDGSNPASLLVTRGRHPDIALDLVGGKMYFTDSILSKVQRADLDGSNAEDLITTGLFWPTGIALDLPNGKMYFTDDFASQIKRADLDGSNVESLLTFTGLSAVKKIALAPAAAPAPVPGTGRTGALILALALAVGLTVLAAGRKRDSLPTPA